MIGPLYITLSQDGDKWCALMGKNLQEGLAGFGITPSEALQALSYEITKFIRWRELEVFGKEKKEDDIYYKTHVVCYNCGWKGEVDILKGMEVEYHLCPQCECGKTLRTTEA